LLPKVVPEVQSAVLLDRLKALHPKIIDLSLDRMHRILAELGSPHLRLPPVVHVAGTNGKGSLVAYLKAIFQAAGYRAHVYTSPHLVAFNERITVAGKHIDEADLTEILALCEKVNADRPITLFEITTAAAFVAYAEFPADVLLLEVGLGGRLDATNVVDEPLLTAITPVSLDHQQYLGETVREIAFEKAGILKRGAPAVVGRQVPEGAGVIEARAKELGVPLNRLGQEWNYERLTDGFRYQDAKGALDMPKPGLFGAHQFDNAATAVACARLLQSQFDLEDGIIARGLTEVSWPARMQRLLTGPLTAPLGPDDELWLDGGHNGHAALALAETFRSWRDKKLDLVYGMLETKDPAEFLLPLSPYIGRLRTVEVPGDTPGIPAAKLAETAAKLGIKAEPAASVSSAIAGLCRDPHPATRVLICGSLYLAGSVLAENK
jgi:dihydrofolate synthase/folylpolyglutamate synthase